MKNIYVLGSINMDMVISTPYMPKNGETLTGSNFFLNGGGKGANQAVAAGKQGSNVKLIASVGDDVFGTDLIAKLNEYNVNTSFINRLANTNTGVAMIIIEDGDNRIILDSGANGKISKEDIDNALAEANNGDIFITQLENNFDAVLYGLKCAKAKGMTTIFNPAPAKVLDNEFFKYVDYLILNETECEIFTGILPTDEASMIKAYEKFQEMGVGNLIITLGSKGSICFSGEEKLVIKAHKVKAIDTTAAGDTYVGSFASRLALGESVLDSLNYASLCSALTCLKKGAQQSIPTLEEVIEYQKNNL